MKRKTKSTNFFYGKSLINSLLVHIMILFIVLFFSFCQKYVPDVAAKDEVHMHIWSLCFHVKGTFTASSKCYSNNIDH